MRTVGWQWVAIVAVSCALAAVLIVSLTVVVVSLTDDAQLTDVGHWLDEHGAGIWTALTGAVAAIASFFFGRARGRRTGHRISAEIARGRPSGDDAAEAILSTDR